MIHGVRNKELPDLWAETRGSFPKYAARSSIVMMLASCDFFLQRLYWLRRAADEFAKKGSLMGEEFNDFGHEAAKIGRKGNKVLIAGITKGFPEPPLRFANEYFSLCLIRNCLLHRMGIVSPEDCKDEKPLEAQWRRIAVEVDGKEVTERPVLIPGGAKLAMPVKRVVRKWNEGDSISFNAQDCQDIGFTLITFCGEMGDKLQSIVRQIPGLPKSSG